MARKLPRAYPWDQCAVEFHQQIFHLIQFIFQKLFIQLCNYLFIYLGRKIVVKNIGIELKGGQWGFGHLRIGIFEKLVTLEISKNSLYRAIFSTFLD